MIPDIAPADHGRVPVHDHQLVVHARVETLHLGDHFAGPPGHAASLFPRIEHTELDVGLRLQVGDQLVVTVEDQVVDDESHFYPTLRGQHCALQEQLAARVRVPEISLDIQGRHRGIHQQQAVVERVVTAVENAKTGILRAVLGGDLRGDVSEDPLAGRRLGVTGRRLHDILLEAGGRASCKQ